MSLPSIIYRELRAESHHSSNTALRLLSASLTIGLFQFVIWDQWASASLLGIQLFSTLRDVLLGLIWVLGPAITADCISRERREGTLGLLFLTPLQPSEIVAGKAVVQMMRLWGIWLATIPVVTIPFILGGVSWTEVAYALALELSSAVLAVSSGLVASSFVRHSIRAYLLAWIIAGLCLLGCDQLGRFWNASFLMTMTRRSPLLNGGFSGVLVQNTTWFWGAIAVILLIGVVILFVTLRLTGWRVARTWRETPLSMRQEKLRRTWFEPRFWRRRFRAAMLKKLERNPIAWLQEYSTMARLSKWGWCMVAICCSLYGFSLDTLSLYWDRQKWVMLALPLGMAFTASNSFYKERESGALELLLVAPISARQLIGGRVLGIWRTYSPAILLLFGLWIFGSLILQGYFNSYDIFPMMGSAFIQEIDVKSIGFFLTSFMTLPLVGMAFSLSMRHFLIAWLSAYFFGVLSPLVMPKIVSGVFFCLQLYLDFNYQVVFPDFLTKSDSMFWSLLTQFLIAGWCGIWLYGSLAARKLLLRPVTA
jgi:ABC-type transport system involved in multi-copper enzyme maturation permease subunit